MKVRSVAFAAVLAVACALFARDAVSATGGIALQKAVTGLRYPVAITHAGDARLFVTQQEGKIVIVENGRVRPEPFLDIESRVGCCGERGLLSVAFHPQYGTNGTFFVNYTDNDGHTIVARYRVLASDPNRSDPGSAEIVLRIEQPYANHNGGGLVFGPDGHLYIGTGDGGSGGDPQNRAQDLGDLLGKILRIDVGTRPYTIPQSNPFVGVAGVRGEIWALGLRNPWRFSFDSETRDLFIADVGQNAWEEVNLQPASSHGGENYGWRRMEGAHCYNPATNCNDGSLELPILEYNHSEGCSITGGYRYRGDGVPQLRGAYVYGDYCTGVIWKAVPDAAGKWSSEILFDSGALVTSFGEDHRGELWMADRNGALYRLVATRARGVRR
ncbi:MAG: PQQ-dependent sugar dehydrogenase [Thermoanaerobaculia bacterium]